MRAKNACLLRYKNQLVMTPGNLFHKGQPHRTSSESTGQCCICEASNAIVRHTLQETHHVPP